MKKKCYNCRKEKLYCEFYKDKSKKDGLQIYCKSCRKNYFANYYLKNKDRMKKSYQEYIENNIEKEKARCKKYRENNIEKEKARCKKYRENNIEKEKLRSSIYYLKNKDRINEINKKWGVKNKEKKYNTNKIWEMNNIDRIRKRKRIYQKRRRVNYQSKLEDSLRRRISDIIKKRKIQRVGSAVRDLGCLVVDLKIYLESRFYIRKNGEIMSWENYGLNGWHIDHIIPLSSFDLSDREQFLKACHYTNLQPLWAEDNYAKGNKTVKEKNNENSGNWNFVW